MSIADADSKNFLLSPSRLFLDFISYLIPGTIA